MSATTIIAPTPLDMEKVKILGEHSIRLREDGMFTAPRSVPAELKSRMRSDSESWMAHARFLQEGEKTGARAAWVAGIQRVEDFRHNADGTVVLDDPLQYDTIILDWEEQDAEADGSSDAVVRRVTPRNKRWGTFWLYDRTLPNEERDCESVTVFFVDWDSRTVYSAVTDMNSAAHDAKDMLNLLQVMGQDMDAAISWGKASIAYREASIAKFDIAADGLLIN